MPTNEHENSSTETLPSLSAEAACREALARHRPAMKALGENLLMNVNLDIPSAITTAIGACSELRAIRPQVARELPHFDLASFDLIEEYALALYQAHGEHLASAASNEALLALNARGQEVRDMLLIDVQALVRRGMVPAPQVAEFKGLTGYKNVATELIGLASVLRGHWAQIAARTGIQLTELDEAERLARQIITALGAREQGPALVAETAQMRQRAFTLFVQAYDDARRAVSYLRWKQGDADAVLPSLYAGRSRRKVEVVTEAMPEGVKGPTPGKPAEPEVPVGFPGGSPFLG